MKAVTKSQCPLCGGSKKAGKTTFSADLGNGVILVRNVPASVCDQCGEAWIDPKTAKQLEDVSREARHKKAQVEIVAMT